MPVEGEEASPLLLVTVRPKTRSSFTWKKITRKKRLMANKIRENEEGSFQEKKIK